MKSVHNECLKDWWDEQKIGDMVREPIGWDDFEAKYKNMLPLRSNIN